MGPVCCDIHSSAPPDAPPALTSSDVNAALRAEALRQLHWQQQEWERRLATDPPGAPCLIALAHRSGRLGNTSRPGCTNTSRLCGLRMGREASLGQLGSPI